MSNAFVILFCLLVESKCRCAHNFRIFAQSVFRDEACTKHHMHGKTQDHERMNELACWTSAMLLSRGNLRARMIYPGGGGVGLGDGGEGLGGGGNGGGGDGLGGIGLGGEGLGGLGGLGLGGL